MVKTSENWRRNDTPMFLQRTWPGRRMEIERAVEPGLVVVSDELLDEPPQVPFIERNEVIKALAAQGTDPAFSDGVRLRGSDWRQDRLYAQPLCLCDELAPVRTIPGPG